MYVYSDGCCCDRFGLHCDLHELSTAGGAAQLPVTPHQAQSIPFCQTCRDTTWWGCGFDRCMYKIWGIFFSLFFILWYLVSCLTNVSYAPCHLLHQSFAGRGGQLPGPLLWELWWHSETPPCVFRGECAEGACGEDQEAAGRVWRATGVGVIPLCLLRLQVSHVKKLKEPGTTCPLQLARIWPSLVPWKHILPCFSLPLQWIVECFPLWYWYASLSLQGAGLHFSSLNCSIHFLFHSCSVVMFSCRRSTIDWLKLHLCDISAWRVQVRAMSLYPQVHLGGGRAWDEDVLREHWTHPWRPSLPH